MYNRKTYYYCSYDYNEEKLIVIPLKVVEREGCKLIAVDRNGKDYRIVCSTINSYQYYTQPSIFLRKLIDEQQYMLFQNQRKMQEVHEHAAKITKRIEGLYEQQHKYK